MDRNRIQPASCCLALIAAVLLPAFANAQSTITTADSSPWQFAATVYAWGPKISGNAVFPRIGVEPSFQLNTSDILNHINMTGMATFDAHYHQFGFFTDVIYLSLGANKSGYRNFVIDDTPIPASVSAYVNLNLKNWIVTSALEYRVADDAQLTMDLLAGARYLYIEQTLSWVLTGNLGPLPPQSRSGSPEVSGHVTDGIVGFKGQFHLGQGWQLPLYFDVGGDFTWQAAAGVGYTFSWGEITAMYRYLNFNLGTKGLTDLTVNGPMLAYTFRW